MSEEKKTKRNAILEFWRFAFCISVLGFHFFSRIDRKPFCGGYLGVEFFFVTAGYFVAMYYEKKMRQTHFKEKLMATKSYLISRIQRLYPMYACALLLMLAVHFIFGHRSIQQSILTLKNCWAEFFWLQWVPGIGNEVLISAGWFVPSVFFSGLLFILLFFLLGRLTGLVIAPILSVLIYRYYFLLIAKIDVIFSYHSVLRGIAGVGAGIFVFYLVFLLHKILSKLPKWLENAVFTTNAIIGSLILLICFIYTFFAHRSALDFAQIGGYCIGLLLLMAGHIPDIPSKVEDTMIFLGKISYPIYIFQMVIITIVLYIKHVPF